MKTAVAVLPESREEGSDDAEDSGSASGDEDNHSRSVYSTSRRGESKEEKKLRKANVRISIVIF